MRGESLRMLLLPAHAMPISIKTRSRDPVPFTIAGSEVEPDGVQSFDEMTAKRIGYGLAESTELVGMMIGLPLPLSMVRSLRDDIFPQIP